VALGLAGPGVLPAGVDCCEVDIRDAAEIRRVCEQVRPEAIYHLAAVASIGAAREDPRFAFEVNVRGTYNIFEAAVALVGVPRLLNVSSSHVYGDIVENVTEDTRIAPSSTYAVTKAMAELAAKLFPSAYGVTVRPFNHTGPGQSRDFVLPSFAAQIAEMEAGLRPPILEVGDIAIERDFLDVRDVVRAYRLVVEKGSRGEVYNVTSGSVFSIASIIDMFREASVLQFEVRVADARRRPGQAQRICASPAKLRGVTAWRPKIPLRDTVRDLLAHWRSLQVNAVGRGA
jgi:GDP-4-dehydro-6-deoxy-D-mannose reductase